MLYWLADRLTEFWGPFRLLSSHLLLMSVGALLSGLLTWYFLPRLWRLLPQDRGKAVVGKEGMHSKGKPTAAGLIFSLLLLPIVFLFVPLSGWEEYGVLLCLYACMLFGFLDDASDKPWGEFKKGMLDFLVTFGATYCLYCAHGSEVWVPFLKGVYLVSPFWYLLGGTFLLWLSTNATNCSDGIDGLAGSLVVGALAVLAILLYLVIGYRPVADYLLIPHNPDAARWAVLAVITMGSVAGYLWYNAAPSQVLMGDAGSRFLGMLIGVLVLVSGNFFLVLVVAPVLLVNGATGLVKLVLLRCLKRLGFDVRPPDQTMPLKSAPQNGLIKVLHSVRFPLHDHFRKKKGWSNEKVLMRYLLIQAVLAPILFILFVKLR